MAFQYDGDPRNLVRWRQSASEPPSIAVWEITLRCDLSCNHCGSRAGAARPNELTTEEALDVVAQLAGLGIREVTLIGGEFYLRKDWDQIAKEIVRHGMFCSVVTGARQLNAERVKQAAEAGVGKISLSLDGLERTHDAFRGTKGSWKNVCDAARRVASSGIDLSFNTQLNRLSMPELPALADLIISLGAKSWMVILTAPMGRAADRHVHLEPYHLLYTFPLLDAIKREKLIPRGVALFAANNVGYFTTLSESLRYGADKGYAWSGCTAGVGSLGIEADGTVKGCPSLPTRDYKRGHLRERPLGAIAADLARETSPPDLWGFCATCPYSSRCRAGCTWTSHVTFGRPGNNPFCHYRALTLANQGVVEKLVMSERAPGVPFDFGHFRIEQASLKTIEADPLIGFMAASRIFGLSKGTDGFWKDEELTSALAKT